MTNLFFQFSSFGNYLTGSKCTLSKYTSPTPYGSAAEAGFSIYQFSDISGSVQFNNLVAGTYQIRYTNGNANDPANYINYPSKVFYVSIPDTSGSLVNGLNYITGSTTGSL